MLVRELISKAAGCYVHWDYSAWEKLCCVTVSSQQYIEAEMDDLLAKQWAGGWTRNLPACMVGMATEPYQYGGSRDHI